MKSKANVVIVYARWDEFGDALLRIPAIRAARGAFPDSHIVYGCQDHTALTTVLRRHVDHLIDEFRPNTPLSTLIGEARSRGASIVVIDFRAVILTLLATRLRLLGSGIIYEANMRGYVASSRHGVPYAPRAEQVAWRNHRLVERAAGRHLPFDHRLPVPDTARALAQTIRSDDTRPLVLICGNGAPAKQMSSSQVATVAAALIDRGFQTVYLETPGHGPTAATLAPLEPRLQIVGPNLGLKSRVLDDVFLALGEMADAYVGIEGGMGHLMATVMTPSVIINHGVKMDRWRPLSNVAEIVDARKECATGRIEDVPPGAIVSALLRLASARRRDHATRSRETATP